MKRLLKLESFARVLTVALSFLAGAYGGIISYNQWINGRHDKKQLVEEKISEVDLMQGSIKSVIDSLSTLTREVRGITPQINQMDQRIDRLIISNENLKGYLLNRALDKNEVLEIIQIWDSNEKKKTRERDSIEFHRILDTMQFKIKVKKVNYHE